MTSNGQEAPPPYNSIFGQLKDQKEQSDGIVAYTKNATGVVSSKAGGVCGLILFGLCICVCSLGLPIAEIVIGSMHLKDCPAERLLPIYLIVLGVFGVVTGSGSVCNKASKRKNEEGEDDSTTASKGSGCCSGLFSLFLFVWFICGNVWVFRMEKCDADSYNATKSEHCFTTVASNSSTVPYCSQLVYDFVFYETIARWALLGVGVVFGCLCCCVMCCVYCCSSKK